MFSKKNNSPNLSRSNTTVVSYNARQASLDHLQIFWLTSRIWSTNIFGYDLSYLNTQDEKRFKAYPKLFEKIFEHLNRALNDKPNEFKFITLHTILLFCSTHYQLLTSTLDKQVINQAIKSLLTIFENKLNDNKATQWISYTEKTYHLLLVLANNVGKVYPLINDVDSLHSIYEKFKASIGIYSNDYGNSLVTKKDYDAAWQAYNEAIKITPKEVLCTKPDYFIHRAKASCLISKPSYTDAIEDFVTAYTQSSQIIIENNPSFLTMVYDYIKPGFKTIPESIVNSYYSRLIDTFIRLLTNTPTLNKIISHPDNCTLIKYNLRIYKCLLKDEPIVAENIKYIIKFLYEINMLHPHIRLALDTLYQESSMVNQQQYCHIQSYLTANRYIDALTEIYSCININPFDVNNYYLAAYFHFIYGSRNVNSAPKEILNINKLKYFIESAINNRPHPWVQQSINFHPIAIIKPEVTASIEDFITSIKDKTTNNLNQISDNIALKEQLSYLADNLIRTLYKNILTNEGNFLFLDDIIAREMDKYLPQAILDAVTDEQAHLIYNELVNRYSLLKDPLETIKSVLSYNRYPYQIAQRLTPDPEDIPCTFSSAHEKIVKDKYNEVQQKIFSDLADSVKTLSCEYIHNKKYQEYLLRRNTLRFTTLKLFIELVQGNYKNATHIIEDIKASKHEQSLYAIKEFALIAIAIAIIKEAKPDTTLDDLENDYYGLLTLPEQAEVKLWQAKVYIGQKDFVKANHCLAQGLTLDPNNYLILFCQKQLKRLQSSTSQNPHQLFTQAKHPLPEIQSEDSEDEIIIRKIKKMSKKP